MLMLVLSVLSAFAGRPVDGETTVVSSVDVPLPPMSEMERELKLNEARLILSKARKGTASMMDFDLLNMSIMSASAKAEDIGSTEEELLRLELDTRMRHAQSLVQLLLEGSGSINDVLDLRRGLKMIRWNVMSLAVIGVDVDGYSLPDSSLERFERNAHLRMVGVYLQMLRADEGGPTLVELLWKDMRAAGVKPEDVGTNADEIGDFKHDSHMRAVAEFEEKMKTQGRTASLRRQLEAELDMADDFRYAFAGVPGLTYDMLDGR